MVLVMVFGLSVVFAKPVVFETDSYTFVADDETKRLDFEGRSEADIIAMAVNAMPKEISGKKAIYSCYEISKVHEITEKYFNYFLYSKDGTYMGIVQDLGDGRELTILFNLEPIE